MKKSKRKPHTQTTRKKRAGAPQTTPEPQRRDVLRLVRNGAIGSAVLGGAGWWGASTVQAMAAEMDLTRVGSGKSTIVQIHDPQCTMCTELQRETRKALKCFDDDDILYLVASIRTTEGSQFAAGLGLGHVTLVLMDGDGAVQSVLQGVRSRDELKPAFQALVASA